VLTYDVARAWIDRWDRQQEGYIPDREERFTVLIDAVEAGVGRPDPLVIDLGCGPGSLAVRLLQRLPRATVIAVDADPVLLALGRAAYGDVPGLSFVDLDLRTPDWSARLSVDRLADAAVSTTALHWLPEPHLRAVYKELATVLRPGGLFLDGDHLGADERATPTLARLERAVCEYEERRRFAEGRPEDWRAWWDAATADPALAEAVALRAERSDDGGHGSAETLRLDSHVSALRDAGFAEIGTLWQHGDNRLLCAIRS